LLPDITKDNTKSSQHSVVTKWAKQFGVEDAVAQLLDHQLQNRSLLVVSPLLYCAEHGHTELAKLLLTDPHFELSGSCFTHAIQSGNDELATLFLTSTGLTHGMAQTALVEACQHGRANIVKLLLSHPNHQVNPAGQNNDQECLMKACSGGHLEVAKLLLKDGRVYPNYQAASPLVAACQFGHVEVVKLLIDNLSQSQFQYVRRLCLGKACSNGKLEVVKLLADGRFDVDRPFSLNVALYAACTRARLPTVHWLLSDSRIDLPNLTMGPPTPLKFLRFEAGLELQPSDCPVLVVSLLLLRHRYRECLSSLDQKQSSDELVSATKPFRDGITSILNRRKDLVAEALPVSDLAELCCSYIPDLSYHHDASTLFTSLHSSSPCSCLSSSSISSSVSSPRDPISLPLAFSNIKFRFSFDSLSNF
jgi:ankyrin repeat protein